MTKIFPSLGHIYSFTDYRSNKVKSSQALKYICQKVILRYIKSKGLKENIKLEVLKAGNPDLQKFINFIRENLFVIQFDKDFLGKIPKA